MQIVAFIFFSAALMLALAVVGQMLLGNRDRIVEALLGGPVAPETVVTAEVIYLQPRNTPEIEWRKAA